MLRYLVDPIFQVINTAGKPTTGGYIEVYLHGTRDKYYCASDFDGTLHPFKIPLDSLGSNIILADDANAYDIYVYNRYGSLLMSRHNVSVSSSGGGGGEAIRKGTIHKIGLWAVDAADPPPKPNEYWVLDLESPNENAPGGYDRLTVVKAREIHNSGAFFGLRTEHVMNPFEDNLLLETYYDYVSMSQTFEVKLSNISEYNEYVEYTLGAFDDYVGVNMYTTSTLLAQDGNGSNVTATFTEANTRTPISSGSKLSVLFGYIAKWFTDLKALAFKDKADLTQDVSGMLPIANGGTNASTASDARTNLDVYSKSEVDNALPQATTTTPSMDGTASVGSETRWAKGDHVHPTDTSREATANKTTTVRQNGQADNTKFPTEAAVRTAIDSAVSSAYHASGTKTVAQLTSSLLVSANEGDVYNITDSGTTTSDFIEGAGHPISAGDNVVVCDVGGGVYKFDLLSGFVDLSGYKTKQTAVSDPTADGNGLTFIDSVSQNANGEIIPHKKTVQDARTTQKGVVQLDNVPTANSTNVPTSGGVYSAMKVGKLHRIGVRSVQAGDPSPKPQTDWIIDLESPNANEPDGYDRLTVSKAIELHENGEIFIFTNFGSATLDSSSCWFYESSVLASSNSITIKLLRSYVSNDVREVQGANLTSFGDYVGVLGWNGDEEFWRETFVTEGSNSLNHNKIHRLRPATDAVIGETSNHNGWVLDLECPNENAPGGYDRLTPQKLKQILDNGEFLVIETYTSGSYIPLALQALVDVQNQNPLRIRVDFVRQYVDSNLLGFEQMTIYTPSGEESYLQMLGIGPSSSWWLDKEALAINGDGSDVTASFTEAQTRANIGTGEKLSILFGKVKKWFTDLKALAFKDKADLTQDVSGMLPIANGGTNASTASDARTNLDVYSTSEVDNALPQATTTTPSMDGTASVGSETRWAKGDHVHPTDTSREATANKTTTVRQNGQADNTKFPTEAAVRTAIDSAVSSAYHAAGTKTVAQLTSSLLVSANEGDVYNITDSGSTTADFVEGAGHPITAGDNVGICNVGGGVYKFDLLSGFVDLTSYLTKTGDGSDVTASFTAASARTNVTTGEKLSVLFGKIAKWFSDLKDLAFKDKVDTADIENDAVTADKVKDGETLPVNVTGYASHLRQAKCKFLGSETGYRLMAELPPSINNYADTCYIFNIYETRDQAELTSGILKGVLSIRIRRDNTLYRYSSAYKGSALEYIGLDLRVNPSTHGINLYATKSGQIYACTVFELLNGYDQYGAALNPTLHVDSELLGSVSGTVVTPTLTLLKGSGGTIPLANSDGVGSASEPVYVSSNGEVLKCTTLWNSIKNNISSNTVNVNQVDNNTETSSFTFVNNHVYHLTVHLQGSPLLTNSTSSGTGYVAAYIGSSLVQSHYSCRQFVDIQQGELTTDDIKFPVDWKAENITDSSDNQLHVEVMLNGSKYSFIQNNYELILQGTDFDGA